MGCSRTSSEVSIVITCVDMLEMTRGCVELMAQNTPPGYELVMVADECSEEMLGWLSQLEKAGAKVITNPKRVGSPTALNMGIRAASRKYIAFVNNDVSVTPGWLEPLLETIEHRPQYGWVTSRVLRMIDEESFIVANFGTASCCLMSREALDKVGLFDERFSEGVGWDDNDMLLRFWRAGYSPRGVLSSTVYHPGHGTTIEAVHGERLAEMELLNRAYFIQKWGPDVMNIDWVSIPCTE